MQNLASIQRRTSPVKFAHLAEKSGKGSISNLSTKEPNRHFSDRRRTLPQAPLLSHNGYSLHGTHDPARLALHYGISHWGAGLSIAVDQAFAQRWRASSVEGLRLGLQFTLIQPARTRYPQHSTLQTSATNVISKEASSFSNHESHSKILVYM